jgi:DNA-binding NtrC family response regulator
MRISACGDAHQRSTDGGVVQHSYCADGAGFVVRSEELSELVARARTIGRSFGPVLVTGESGTGKTLLCQEIHRNSRARSGPLLKKGCGEFDEGTLAAAIFGHLRGAFTSAVADRAGILKLADGGSLVLDDIDCLSPAGQAHLLRFLDDGQFDAVGGSGHPLRANVRVIATTNKNLQELSNDRRFRADLLYRLRRWRLHISPLRERPDDVKALAQSFLARCPVSEGERPKRFTSSALDLLALLPWPSNVRGLRDAVENVALFATGQGDFFDVPDLVEVLFDPTLGPCTDDFRTALKSGEPPVDELLKLTHNNVTLTAKVLGCARNTVYKFARVDAGRGSGGPQPETGRSSAAGMAYPSSFSNPGFRRTT